MDELKNDVSSETVEIPLRANVLGSLAPEIETPRHKRGELTPGIAHIGAGVRPGDAAMREMFLAQDCLTNLIELRLDGTFAEVCGSMIDFLTVEAENGRLIEQMVDPSTRFVSLTLTEGAIA